MQKTAAGPAAVSSRKLVLRKPGLPLRTFSQTEISLAHKVGKAKIAVFKAEAAVGAGHGLIPRFLKDYTQDTTSPEKSEWSDYIKLYQFFLTFLSVPGAGPRWTDRRGRCSALWRRPLGGPPPAGTEDETAR